MASRTASFGIRFGAGEVSAVSFIFISLSKPHNDRRQARIVSVNALLECDEKVQKYCTIEFRTSTVVIVAHNKLRLAYAKRTGCFLSRIHSV